MVDHIDNAVNLMLDQQFMPGNVICAQLMRTGIELLIGADNVKGNDASANCCLNDNS